MNKNVKVMKRIVLFSIIMLIISLLFVACNVYLSNTKKPSIDIDFDTIELVQLDEPENGDTIAIIETSLGEIRAVLYPEYSPNLVNNFIELAESGYYNNTYVFHSEKNVYASAGTPNKDGSLNSDYNPSNELIEMELHQNLWPFKGAICSMVTNIDRGFFESLKGETGTYYCGSRFSFINSIEFTDDVKKEMYESSSNTLLPDAFAEKGGIPNFSQQMTVIGQTYQGLEVIDALTSIETNLSEKDNSTKIPVEDIMIISVTIDTYSEETTSTNAE